MNLSVQHTLIPGTSLTERFQRAADYGFDGVELVAWGFDGPMVDHFVDIENAMRASGLRISSLCTMRDDDFVHPDAAERQKRLSGLVQMLTLADAVGAGGVVALPIRQPLSLPDLSPVADEHTLITQLVVALLQSALERTSDKKAAVFLEPLNRYEARYLRTIGHAAELCQQTGSPRVRIMADMFHMNIEEASIPDALHAVAAHVGHVHLADSNRLLPGHGHTDFVEPFRVLKTTSFAGWMALECAVPGDPAQTLPASVRFIRDCWNRA